MADGLAFVATFPVNRWLIGRGRGHALVHGFHTAAPPAGPTEAPQQTNRHPHH